uniref:RNase H type-1 domain-containing protein n=1 Tax=Setaria digitata TaxID=48799 RepID=A0A915PQH4_9BILA
MVAKGLRARLTTSHPELSPLQQPTKQSRSRQPSTEYRQSTADRQGGPSIPVAALHSGVTAVRSGAVTSDYTLACLSGAPYKPSLCFFSATGQDNYLGLGMNFFANELLACLAVFGPRSFPRPLSAEIDCLAAVISSLAWQK